MQLAPRYIFNTMKAVFSLKAILGVCLCFGFFVMYEVVIMMKTRISIRTCLGKSTCNSCLMVFTVMGFVLPEGCIILCTVKTMRQLTCTDRPYKANHQIVALAPECLYYSTYMYCMPSVQHKVLHAVATLV